MFGKKKIKVTKKRNTQPASVNQSRFVTTKNEAFAKRKKS